MKPSGESWLGRLTRGTGHWLVRRFYPRMEISGAERVPPSGPVLICANHANSLLDPVLIGIAANRPVRFLAKAPLFDAPLVGDVMRGLGMLPAYRGSDDPKQVRRNLESLDVASQALVAGHAMGIFPEGKSHDVATVDTVRSGAARIAVGAQEAGAKNVQIVPVGINYERKERSLTSVWIQVGEPIDVDRWLADHGGESRPAMRALTPELEKRLKAVVVHLDEPKWEPLLAELDVLAPPATRDTGRAPAVRRRKRIADAINHFLAADRPRAEAVAQSIADHRDAVERVGLRISAPILKTRGWSGVPAVVWRWLTIVLLFVPALVGTLFHVVPFTFVRALAARLRAPGLMTNSLTLLAVGIPLYAAWYAVCGWWLFDYFADWFAAVILIAMPFLGILALAYWRNMREVWSSGWHKLRFLLRRGTLRELREQRQVVQQQLAGLAAEYETVRKASSAATPVAKSPEPSSRGIAWRRAIVRLACVGAIVVGGWFVWHRYGTEGLVEASAGVNLAAADPAALRTRLDGDEKSLLAVLDGLKKLEADATALTADFAAGRRSFRSEADSDAVSRLLLTYINYRTLLVRLIWRYQRYAELEDETVRLRSFLVGFTSASALYDASLKFVYQFSNSPETVARLNEGEPVWGIPAGLYDTIERKLANRANMSLLEASRDYYLAAGERFDACGLGKSAAGYAPFHEAIAGSRATAERLGGSQWKQETVVAAKDLHKLVGSIRYRTQSAISTWIGDVKIREPREGAAMITPAHLARLQEKLRPGDILLERRNWFMSNAFLPGYWPHAALYVGTIDDLARLGLDQDDRVRPFWDRYSQPDDHGRRPVIIEALSEGVVFNSLEHSIGGADSAAVLRPRLTEAEIKEAIARAFGNAAKPYDFEFDFESRDKLVCTEVVFRAYGANAGPIRFPLKDILGRQTMPAIEIVRKVKQEADTDTADLDFIAFIDGDELTGEVRYSEDSAEFFATLDRPGMTLLQGFEQQPAKRIGPLGWTLLGLVGAFTLGNFFYYGRRGGATR